MASFSFGAGNLGKILRIPLYLAGRAATALIPRGKRWVFGCGAGIGDGALALWTVAKEQGHDVLWLTSSAREERDAAVLGIRTLPREGWRGWWATARAGVLVVTHGLGDVNRYTSAGAFVVQLWHGIPLKRIGLDSPATSRTGSFPGAAALSRMVSVLYRQTARQIDLIPAASHRARGRLESAFGLPAGRVLVTGEPRVDVLSAGEPQERTVRARALLEEKTGPLPEDAGTILYAPTWRDGAPDPAVPGAFEWERIIEVLEEANAVLFVRSHPLGEGAYLPPSTERVRLLGASLLADVTPALPGIDILVTDYSSLAYDVGLQSTPVVYLAPDADAYATSRGFYGRYEDVAGEDPARDWTQAAAQLRVLLTDSAEFTRRAERSRTLSGEIHDFHDGGNTRRVYRAIRARSSAAHGDRGGRKPPRGAA